MRERMAVVALVGALLAGVFAGAAMAATEENVPVKPALEGVRAVTLGDGAPGLEVRVKVTLENWSGSEFPAVMARLVAFTTEGDKTYTPAGDPTIETLSASEAVAIFRFQRPEDAPYMVVFVGLPAAGEGDDLTRTEGWSGAIFTASEIQG